jgi:glycosyltransferase involved in cell wall biosynthesis
MTVPHPLGDGAGSLRIAYVLGTYPLPTTTFIDREIQQLRRMGVGISPIAIRRPKRTLSTGQRDLQADVRYVLPASAPAVAWSHLRFLATRPGVYLRTLAALASRPHPSLAARLRTVGHFALGVHVARLVREAGRVDHIHAHFVDRAALIALVVGRLLDRPYSATAHANDIYVRPVLLSEKLAEAKFVATCTKYNERHLRSVLGSGAERTVRCIYHGLDLPSYEPSGHPRSRPLLLSIGQLKEKKGLAYLLDACRLLGDRGVDFECEIVGDGPLRTELESRRDALSLGDRVRFLGTLAHDEVIARYADATVFVLPCVTARDGDRDGIPNVILEAMAMGLPVVSTRHSGIPEAVDDGRTGDLVPPEDANALADALARLLADEARRERFGRAGRRRAKEIFDVEVNVQRLLEEFVA